MVSGYSRSADKQIGMTDLTWHLFCHPDLFFRALLAHLGRDFVDRAAPTWAAGPSKVVILLQRGIKITKRTFLINSHKNLTKVHPKVMLMSQKWGPRRPQGLQWCLQVVPRAPKIDQKSIKFCLGGHVGATCAKKCPQIDKQKRRKASKTQLFNEKR